MLFVQYLEMVQLWWPSLGYPVLFRVNNMLLVISLVGVLILVLFPFIRIVFSYIGDTLLSPTASLMGGDTLGLPVLQTECPSQATDSCQEVGKYFSAIRGKINLARYKLLFNYLKC